MSGDPEDAAEREADAGQPEAPDPAPADGPRSGAASPNPAPAATPQVEDTEAPDETPADEAASPYGEPGAPLRRSPFMVGLTGGFGLVVAYLAYQAVRSTWGMLVLIVVAGFLAIGLNPAVVRLEKFGLSRGLAVTVVALTGLLVGCGGLFALVPPMINETIGFIDALPGYIESLRNAEWINDFNDRYDVLGALQDALTAGNITVALAGVLTGAGIVFSQLFNVLTIGVLTLYFLGAFERLKEGAYRLVPASRRQRARLLGDEILTKVGGYMVGSLTIAALAGLTSLVFMLVTGIPYALALALVVAICDLIPQIGATLGALVLTLVGLTVSIPVAIAALIFFILYQQLENWVIYPRVMARTTAVSDLAAILGVLIGASILGVVGVLIAIPATAAIQLVVREVIFPRQNAH